MQNKLRLVFLILNIFLFSICRNLNAFDTVDAGLKSGGSSFLDIGWSARSAGMGGAFASIAEGADGYLYNPAGLAFSSGFQIANMSCLTGMDRDLFFTSAYIPLVKKVEDVPAVFKGPDRWFDGLLKKKKYNHTGIAVSYESFGISDIEGRDELGNPTGSFIDTEKLFSTGIGYGFFENLGAGFNVKYITQDLRNSHAEALLFDLGVIYKLLGDKISFGFAARDLLGDLKWEITDETLNTEIKYEEPVLEKYDYGISYKFINSIASFDIVKIQNSRVWTRIGFEYWLNNMVNLRCGLDKYKPTLGFGLKHGLVKNMDIWLDYAFKYDIDGLSNFHFFNLNLGFGVI